MLNPDYRDMLSALSEAGVEHMVVGAYALAYHGLPRATGDIDIWVRCSRENAQRVWAALKAFGAPLGDLSLDDLETPGIVLQIGVAPRRIDILTSIDGVEWDAAAEAIEVGERALAEAPSHQQVRRQVATARDGLARAVARQGGAVAGGRRQDD